MPKNRRGKSHRKSSHISANSDNRKYCVGVSRQKFCYETYEKARRACDYSPNPQRVYYCDFCCAYHTTKMLDREKFYTTLAAQTNRLIRKDIERREKLRDMNKSRDTNKLRDMNKPKSEAVRRLEMKLRIQKRGYTQIVEDYLIEHLLKPAQPDQLILVKSRLVGIFGNLKDPYDSIAKFEASETLGWPFRKITDAIIFFILFYLDDHGWIMAKKGGVLEEIFYLDTFSKRTLDKMQTHIANLIEKEMIVAAENSDGATIYKLSSKENDAGTMAGQP